MRIKINKIYSNFSVSLLIGISGIVNWIIALALLSEGQSGYILYLTGIACFRIYANIVSKRTSKIEGIIEGLGLECLQYLMYSRIRINNFDCDKIFLKLSAHGPLACFQQFLFISIQNDQVLDSFIGSTLIFSFILNLLITSHFYYVFLNQSSIFQLSQNLSQYFCIFIQTSSYLFPLFIISSVNNILFWLLGISLISIIICYYLAKKTQHHNYFCYNTKETKTVGMAFMLIIGIPSTFAPYFSLGTLNMELIALTHDSIRDTFFYAHTGFVNFLHRSISFALQIVISMMAILNSNINREFRIISLGLILVNIIITLPYIINMMKQYKNKQFEYLYLMRSSLKEVAQLISKPEKIKILKIDSIEEDRQGYEIEQNEQLLVDADLLIKEQIFELIYVKFPISSMVWIEIENFIKIENCSSVLNSKYFGDCFLSMIRSGRQLPQRTIRLEGRIGEKSFQDKYIKSIIQRLFLIGYEQNFTSKITCNEEIIEIINYFLSKLLAVQVFHKIITPHMNMNPKQIIYDLFD